ncbi:MAG: hypothetical protein WBF08_11040 [Candidatus Bathyarchaeia archaeon]
MHKLSVIFMFLLIFVASITLNVEAQGITVTMDKTVYYNDETGYVTNTNNGQNTVDISTEVYLNGNFIGPDAHVWPPGSFTNTIDFSDPSWQIGTYTWKLKAVDQGTGAVYYAQASFQLKARGPPFDFTILLSPTSVTVEPGDVGSFKVLLTYSDPSHQGTVINIQVTGLGSGMNFQLSALGDLTITTSSTTPPGTYPFTVIGSAQGKTHQTSGIIIVTAKAPSFDFSVAMSPSTQTIELKEKTTYTVNVALVSGTGETVTLTTSGLPGDIQNSLSTASGTAPYSSTLTVDTATATYTGTFTITITATGAGKTKTATATLTVEEEADFSITASPVNTEIKQGDSTTFMLNINEIGGFDQSVSLTAVGLPSDASPSFSPASGKPVFTSTLTISTTESTPTGSFTVTVDASGGGKTRSATVTLTIKEKPQEATATTTQTTPSGESSEKSTLESNLSTLLSNPTYLLIIIIIILAVSLGAIALKRGRAPTPTQPRPQAPTGYCVNCGGRLNPGESFCHLCGQKVE